MGETGKRDELTTIPIARIVADVERCVQENISVAGLALALTIPDILGAQCFPQLCYEDGQRRVGAQYTRWFDKYVARSFVDKAHWFTGEMCYQLRCDILHSGTSDIEYHHSQQKGVAYRYSFVLVDDGEQGHVEHMEDHGQVCRCQVRLNADNLSKALCEGARRCLADADGQAANADGQAV